MSESTIGIKIADGSYFPILKDNSDTRKRLVLTTVNDQQDNVQIDLYRGKGEEIEQATYIGSLQIENIEPMKKGEPDIELLIGLDENGNLDATASDRASGESQSLSVSLESLDQEETYDDADFSIDSSSDDSEMMTPEEESQLVSSSTQMIDEAQPQAPKKKKSPFATAAFIVIGLIVIVLIVFFIISIIPPGEIPQPLEAKGDTAVISNDDNGPPAIPQTEEKIAETKPQTPAAENSSKVETAAPAPKAEDKPIVREEKPETAKPSSPALAEKPATQAEKSEQGGQGDVKIASGEKKADNDSPSFSGGVWYKISRGDTLWDLASSFYNDPFEYPSIADENKIDNPDLIIAGKNLFIPGKSDQAE